MKNFAKLFLILTVLLVLPLAALAAPVGKVTSLEGNVDITAGDKVRTATLGEPVNAGDVLRAKSKAKAEVTFLDGNILRLAESTRVRITDYQSGEGKTTTLDLFRGKTQNIVSGLAKNARYEVHTPTAVCGVRGTNFFSFFHNGVSGFVPKEGTIYGYNRNTPREVRTVTPGQAIMVLGANQPAVIQPATSIEVEKHVSDTAPGEEKGDKGKDKKDKDAPPGLEGGLLQLPTFSGLLKEINIGETNLEKTLKTDDWSFETEPGVKLIAKTYFPLTYGDPPVGGTAGVFTGVLYTDTIPAWDVDSQTIVFKTVNTNVGKVDMTLQFAPGNVPQLEVGNVIGQMQDGSGFTGLMTSIPGSWMGAMSGIYAGGTGVGMYLGYLEGTYNPDNGRLIAGGGLARTPLLGPPPTAFGIVSPYTFEFLGLDAPGVAAVSVAETPGYPSYVSSGIVSADYFSGNVDIGAPYAGASQNYLSSSLLTAWAVTRINDSGGLSYNSSSSSPKTWMAKYGYSGYNSSAEAPYFIVGDVTGYESGAGTETDPTRLRLSGRNLLYITPGYNNFDPKQFTPDSEGGKFAYGVPSSMGYFNFELWNGGAYGYGGGAGTLELAPTAFGGYWGYDMSNPTCLYYNDRGGSLHVADEWGLIGAWTAPWNAPANIKIAGAYQMDDGNSYSYAPGYLWNSPIGNRPQPSDAFYNDPTFQDGDFFGATAGRIGLYAPTGSNVWVTNAKGDREELPVWERGAKGALAALYVNEGQAGLLTTFAPGSALGGLTGGFFRDETGYGGFWWLDGTLTATPMTSGNLSDFSLREMGFDVTAGYQGADSNTYIRGYGENTAFYLNAYDANLDTYRALPWGVYALSIGGDYDEYDETYYIPSARYSGKTADLSGKDIKVGGVYGYGPQKGYWIGAIKRTLWTPTVPASASTPESGEISGVASGDYISRTQYGTFGGPFYGLYDEDYAGAGYGGWIGESVGTYQGESLAFSSLIEGYTYKSVLNDGVFSFWTGPFNGIMGGLSANLWTNKTSPIKFLGVLGAEDWMESLPTAPFVAASEIGSYIPQTSSFTGAYQGFLSAAVDSANALSGGIMALYQEGYGGYGGILYSNDITGTVHPAVGAWVADGTLNVYPLTTDTLSGDPKLFAQSLQIEHMNYNYASGAVPVNVISGGTIDMRIERRTSQTIPYQPWGIWNIAAGGTYTGDAPRSWVESREYEPTTGSTVGSTPSGWRYLYVNTSMGTPVNGVSTGTVAGSEDVQPTTVTNAYTVVFGGVVKGLFDPATTPMTWTSIAQGGFMETNTFITRQSAMDDAAKANFERAMKIPAFDVGIANLRGNDGNLYVNMDGIKFFRFQTEANPRIWATGSVYGSYTSNPGNGVNMYVPLNSSGGDLSGLTHTFEVRNWNTDNNNWGATIYKGAGDTGGTLTRSATDAARLATGYLPAGATTTIPITELRGAAAGTIKPGVNATGLPGSSSFVGTAAGTVR